MVIIRNQDVLYQGGMMFIGGEGCLFRQELPNMPGIEVYSFNTFRYKFSSLSLLNSMILKTSV